jgi:hypothetical protein
MGTRGQSHIHTSQSSGRSIRPVHVVERCLPAQADGIVHVRSTETLEHYPGRLTDCLRYWAQKAPNRIFGAKPAKRRMGRHHICRRVVPYTPARGRTGQTGLVADDADNDSLPNSIEHGLLAIMMKFAGILVDAKPFWAALYHSLKLMTTEEYEDRRLSIYETSSECDGLIMRSK